MQYDIAAVLKNIPSFSHLSEQALEALASCAKIKAFPKHAIIIHEGDETSPLHILLAGKARVFLSDEDGKEVTLGIQEPGTFFGELALLDDQPRSASVITLEKTTCGIISKNEFKAWLADHPDAALSLLQNLVEKIRHLTESVKRLALSDVYGRLIKVLQDMAIEKDGLYLIPERPTQQDLASMIGASREMVSKIIKELTKGDYIKIEGKSLTINKKLPSSW